MNITDNQLLEYSRQIMVTDFDVAGQENLLQRKVMIVGAGGLGCSVALYLAGSGIGSIHLIDDDVIELSNLPRQILFAKDNIGQSKSLVAANRLNGQFESVAITAEHARFSIESLDRFYPDLIIDCGDNMQLTHLIGGISEDKNIAVVHASVSRTEGHLYTYIPRQSKPIHQLFLNQESNETCSQSGVMTAVVGIVASMQAWQAIRVLSAPNLGVIKSELLLFDAKTMRLTPLAV